MKLQAMLMSRMVKSNCKIRAPIFCTSRMKCQKHGFEQQLQRHIGKPCYCQRSEIYIYLKTRYTPTVHVITKKRLIEFSARYPASRDPLLRWYRIISQTNFESFAALRLITASADQVEKFTVFNIGGNKYRLIAAIHYNRHRVYIRHVLTHAEYDKGKWKEK